MDAIAIEHLWKGFWLGQAKTSMRKFLSGLLYAISSKGKAPERFWALKDVSLQLRQGETLGLVGLNGSGKSTLLKLFSKVLKPDRGEMVIRGSVGALIELGAGFHPELTGRENIYLNGVILGLTRKEIDRKFDEIVEFSGIGDFMDTPVKRYSSGMYVRLGFSVAAHMNPDILLIDEVLAVGDYQFQDKCVEWLRNFRKKGRTIVVVSHNRVKIEQLCDRAVLLHKGQIIREGEPYKVMDDYYEMFNPVADSGESWNEQLAQQMREKKAVVIEKVELVSSEGHPVSRIKGGEPAKVVIHYKAYEDVEGPIFFHRIFRTDGVVVHMNNTKRAGLKIKVKAGERGRVEIKFLQLQLLTGNYYMDAGIMQDLFSASRYDWKFRVCPFYVETRLSEGGGIALCPHQWEIHKNNQ